MAIGANMSGPTPTEIKQCIQLVSQGIEKYGADRKIFEIAVDAFNDQYNAFKKGKSSDFYNDRLQAEAGKDEYASFDQYEKYADNVRGALTSTRFCQREVWIIPVT